MSTTFAYMFLLRGAHKIYLLSWGGLDNKFLFPLWDQFLVFTACRFFGSSKYTCVSTKRICSFLVCKSVCVCCLLLLPVSNYLKGFPCHDETLIHYMYARANIGRKYSLYFIKWTQTLMKL